MKPSDRILYLVRLAVRRWRPVILVPFAFAITSAVLSLLSPRDWLVPFAFVSESDSEKGGSSLAAELGLGSSNTVGPDFYVDLLKMDEPYLPLMSKQYTTGSARKSTTLVKLLGGSDEPSGKEIAAAVKELHLRVVASSSRRSGVVSVSVRLPDQQVSKSLADDILAAINNVNTRVRQTKAHADRVFTEQRLAVIRGELRQAENDLKAFLENNRFLASPTLQVERMRREREVTIKAATLQSVEIAYESARRDEVKNTPQISVIDRPRLPEIGRSRNTLRKMVIVSAVAFLVILALIWRAEMVADGSIRTLLVVERDRVRQLLTEEDPPSVTAET